MKITVEAVAEDVLEGQNVDLMYQVIIQREQGVTVDQIGAVFMEQFAVPALKVALTLGQILTTAEAAEIVAEQDTNALMRNV